MSNEKRFNGRQNKANIVKAFAAGLFCVLLVGPVGTGANPGYVLNNLGLPASSFIGGIFAFDNIVPEPIVLEPSTPVINLNGDQVFRLVHQQVTFELKGRAKLGMLTIKDPELRTEIFLDTIVKLKKALESLEPNAVSTAGELTKFIRTKANTARKFAIRHDAGEDPVIDFNDEVVPSNQLARWTSLLSFLEL